MTSSLGRAAHLDGPLYAEVRRRILAALQSGEWPHGGRLPTEPQLAARYAVSVGTVRKAVDALVAERLLLRQPGRGTFVASQTDQDTFARYLRFFDPQGERVVPQASLLAFRRERAPRPIAARLGVAPGTALLRIDNLRTWQGVPVMVDHIHLPSGIVPGMTKDRFIARGGSIYAFYQDQSAVTVLRVEESLSAVSATPDVAGHLRLPHGAPLLLVERTAFTFQDRPVEFRHRYVDTARLSYRAVIGLHTGD